MESITVRVVDEDNKPIERKKVTIFLTHTLMPHTWLEEYTDYGGRAYFSFDDCVSVDVHVGGSCHLKDVGDEGDCLPVRNSNEIRA